MLRMRKFFLGLAGVLLLLHSVIPHLHIGKDRTTAAFEWHNQSCSHEAFSLTSLFAHNHSSISSPDVYLDAASQTDHFDQEVFDVVIRQFPLVSEGAKVFALSPALPPPSSIAHLSCSAVRPPPSAWWIPFRIVRSRTSFFISSSSIICLKK